MLKNQVTTGEWDVGQIEYVDETNKYVYFTARGREPGVPYYARLYRVELRRLGPHAADARRRASRHRLLA